MQDQIEAVRSQPNITPPSQTEIHDMIPQAIGAKSTDRSIKHRTADVLSTQAEIRSHARAMMGLDPDSRKPWMNVPSPQEVRTFTQTRRGGPSIENFRPDLTGSRSTAWNKRLADVFVDDFVAQDHFTNKDRKAVLKAFKTHFLTLRSHYLKALNDAEEQEQIDAARADARVQRQRAVRHCLTSRLLLTTYMLHSFILAVLKHVPSIPT